MIPAFAFPLDRYRRGRAGKRKCKYAPGVLGVT